MANGNRAGQPPAGIINLQVLGNGANHGPKALYLFTDQARYLFNCGEGTQRLAREHKIKWGRLEHIFLTNNSWGMIGGLPGMALTIQEIGPSEITLHGPPGLGSLFEGTRRFVILKDLKINVANAGSGGFFEDHVLRVQYVPIYKDNAMELPPAPVKVLQEEDDVDYYENYRGIKKTKMVTVVKVDSDGGDDSGRPCSLCYIVEPKKKDGQLLIDRCIEKGVPPGPLLGKLKAGLDVTLANGKIVLARDVRTADCPGPRFLVVDCPDKTYLASLLSSKELLAKDYYLVVHFTPKEVMLEPSYVQWMESEFRISTQHLVLNDLCTGIGSEAVHRLQTKLAIIDPSVFPALQEETGGGATGGAGSGRGNSFFPSVPYVTLGETLLKYNLRPGTSIDETSVVSLNTELYVSETDSNDEFKVELEKFNVIRSRSSKEEGSYPRVTFLGTGSSIPNKTRNVSSIILQVTKEKSVLLDCGEGTTGQLARFYGQKNFTKILDTIKVIYISHLHADHHIGLISLLQAISATNTGRESPVQLIAPLQLKTWLNEFDVKFERLGHMYDLIPITDFKCEFLEKKCTAEKLKSVLNSIDCCEIQTDYVKHCPSAFGVSFKFNFDWKFTYSGDTMPCNNLIKIGMNSDLLVHEATMEDELVNQAAIKKHSTVTQALNVAKQMMAKFVILTHFSQRYAKVPLIPDDSGSHNDQTEEGTPTGVAFDNMTVVKEDLKNIASMYPVLKALFAENCDEMEARSAKLRKKKEVSDEIEQAAMGRLNLGV